MLLALPHVVETVQFGDNLVFWIGDKAIGGKMFALLALDATPGQPLVSFAAAGREAYADLLEREGLVPAPYLARIQWVAATDWEALNAREWADLLLAAHTRTLEKLPPKARAALALPARQQQRLILDRRHLLQQRTEDTRNRQQADRKQTAGKQTADKQADRTQTDGAKRGSRLGLENLGRRVKQPAKAAPVRPDQKDLEHRHQQTRRNPLPTQQK